MIIGIGIDVTEIGRIKSSLEKFGPAFLNRVLRPEEIAYCEQHRDLTPHVAARFAAKEAVSKAFGTGITAELGWHDIEIARRDTGEPFVVLHAAGKLLFEKRSAKNLLLSLSHSQNYATAVAILEN